MEMHLIRHGQTNWNEEGRVQGQSESRLTPLGIQQARDVGSKLQHISFDRLYCSSSRRTRETARYTFARQNQPIGYLDSLREIAMGPWEGRLHAEIEQEAPDSFRHFWHEPHLFNVAGAETFYDLQRRAMNSIREIASDCRGQRVAVISHGALIKSILAHIEKLPMDQLWTPPIMHNCAHNIIQLNESGEYSISLYADQSYESVRPGEPS